MPPASCAPADEPAPRSAVADGGSPIREALAGWRGLLARSRPGAWPMSALPFLVAAFDAGREIGPILVLGTLYFLGPYNLLLHGSDAGASTAEPTAGRRSTRLAIAVTNLPFLVALVLLGGPAGGLAMLVTVAVALAYSTPPVRTADRPVLDSITRVLHLVLPAVVGSLIAGRTIADLPWLALAAFAAWVIASELLREIADGQPAATAGRRSIATIVGTRLTAVGALAGYTLCAVLTVKLGRLGALGALGLDLFLLLPAMVLLAPRDTPGAAVIAARRAWSGFLGLRSVVGLWLAALLLRHWGLFAGLGGLDIVTIVAAAVAGYAGWNIVATRVATRRRRTHPAHEREILPLTIIVSCHDEVDRLADCLEALLDQTYADTSILVVDSRSTDGSPDYAAEILGNAGRVISAPPTPDGWSERSWARWTGVQAADTALVLFVDLDTVLVPVAARLLVEQLEHGGWDLLSGVTRLDMPTSGERATVPGFPMLLLGFRPIWVSAITGGRPASLAFADDPLSLVRRDAYEACGGHGTVPGSRTPSLDLARTFARAGRRVRTVHLADLAASRPYPGADVAVRAWRRTFVASAGGSLAGAILAIGAQSLAYLVPMLLPPLALLVGAEPRTVLASCIPLFLLGFARFALVLTQRQPLSTVFWHPVTIGVALIGQLAAVADHVSGRLPSREAADRPVVALAAPTDQG